MSTQDTSESSAEIATGQWHRYVPGETVMPFNAMAAFSDARGTPWIGKTQSVADRVPAWIYILPSPPFRAEVAV